jgi:hypothetical protein
MGIAFMAALLLIYGLIVWEFRDFAIAGLIMSPIPLTLIGIIPGHLFMGAEFTATSMIGMIALGGIIVRQSILIVEFVKIEVARGKPVREAAVDGAEIRMRPILITSLTLMAGAWAIIDDPIFQGMAVSLLFGAGVATLMAVIVIPLGCLSLTRRFYLIESESGERMLSARYAEIEGGGSGGASGGHAGIARGASDAPRAGDTGARDRSPGGGLPVWMIVWSVLVAVVSALINGVIVLVRLAGVLIERMRRETDDAASSRSAYGTGSGGASGGRGGSGADTERSAAPAPAAPSAAERAADGQPLPAADVKAPTPPARSIPSEQPEQPEQPSKPATTARSSRVKTGAKAAVAKKTPAKKTGAQRTSATSRTKPASAKKRPTKKAAQRKTTAKKTPAARPDGGSASKDDDV